MGELTHAAEALDIDEKTTKTYKKEESNDSEDLDEISISDESEMLLEDYLIYIISVKEKLIWIAHQKAKAIFEWEMEKVKKRLPAREKVDEFI